MKGLTFKRTIAPLALFSTTCLTSLAFATSTNISAQTGTHQEIIKTNKPKMTHSGAGCMACHQSENAPDNEPAKKTS